MNKIKISVEGLGKTYINGPALVQVLRGIDLCVSEREFLAIEGPSGAGKSTLLHILGGLDKPSCGEVIFDGENIYGSGENQRAIFRNSRIGFVFQFFHLLPELSALENVLLPAILKSWRERKKMRENARLILEGLGLAQRLEHLPAQLSGGEQQRVAIARALINRPEVILCDEPTGNLDSQNGENILRLLRKLNKEDGTTIVLVTHDKDIAASADRVVYLKDGIILN